MNHPLIHNIQRFRKRFPQLLPLLALFFLLLWTIAPTTALANEDASSLSEEEWGQQAFLQFFGPDGVNECLEEDPSSSQTPASYAQDQAVLTTSWETVGSGRINRKYLNGLIAFCFDEELSFPNGATYAYVTASDAAITGQAAVIVSRFASSGIDNAQWWSQCQVAIWAVRAGCTTTDSAAAFARSYCADRKISDPDTVADYAHIVGTLVKETAGHSATAYLYQAEDPANQRILTYTAIWPDPAPSYPSPQFKQVSASASHTAQKELTLSIQNKYAAVTNEALAGAVFQIYDGDTLLGTVTTDAQGLASFLWTVSKTATAQYTMEYCSNYQHLDPETRNEITGYTSKDQAYNAAFALAQEEASLLARQALSQPHTLLVKEVTSPHGFSISDDGTHTVTFYQEESVALSIANDPWKSQLIIRKVDGITGQPIPAETTFSLYEWNGSAYEISSQYQILRREDGSYTVTSCYEQGEEGYLYYTQENQGRFALVEETPPKGYLSDSQWCYLQVSPDSPLLYGHNSDPAAYPILDETVFANLPVTGTIKIYKEGEFLSHVTPLSPKESDVFFDFGYTTGPVCGTVFAIYAAEDILQPGGSEQLAVYHDIPLAKDTLAATVVTSKDGWATLEGLPLGSYFIREESAGIGPFLTDPTITYVTLNYAGPEVSVVTDQSSRYHNKRQQLSIQLTKRSSTSHRLLAGAVYGLYTTQDIYGEGDFISQDALIPAGTLLEQVTTDQTGQATFSSHLPNGVYTIQELTPPPGYLLNQQVHTIHAGYTHDQAEECLSFSFTMKNDPEPDKHPKPKLSQGAPTGDPAALCMYLCLLMFSGMGSILLITRRRIR